MIASGCATPISSRPRVSLSARSVPAPIITASALERTVRIVWRSVTLPIPAALPHGCPAIHRADRVDDHVRSCALAVRRGRKVQVIVDGKDLLRRGRVKPEYPHTL